MRTLATVVTLLALSAGWGIVVYLQTTHAIGDGAAMAFAPIVAGLGLVAGVIEGDPRWPAGARACYGFGLGAVALCLGLLVIFLAPIREAGEGFGFAFAFFGCPALGLGIVCLALGEAFARRAARRGEE